MSTRTIEAKPDRRSQILDIAERMARRGGYNGFSFREIAAEAGVKSASVHYHFPTKAGLATALCERYTRRFLEGLGPPTERGALLRLIGAYRAALREEERMCLCGVFGAEIDALPEVLAHAVRGFFSETVAWTAAALGEPEGERTGAETLVAGLEGAMITARALGDPDAFDRMAARLLDAARGRGWAPGEAPAAG